MDKERSLASLIFPGFRFGEDDPEAARRLVDLGVGGFCVYRGLSGEVLKFTPELNSRAKEPLLFCADYEDGPGWWVSGSTELPSNMAIGASGSAEFAEKKARITAVESRALGVEWIFAPVVDLAARPENPIVNTRAFGAEPELVGRLSRAYLKGLSDGGTLNCVKHFPGHGETEQDSHLALPSLKRTLKELEASELLPYFENLDADSVMIGHLHFEDLDKDFPASFSRKIITGLLREKMGYKGCVVTDALSMKAISDEKIAGVAALKAGADVLLVPDDAFKLLAALKKSYRSGEISDGEILSALKNVSALRKKLAERAQSRPPESVIGCAEHAEFIKECAPKCLAWAKKPERPVLGKGDCAAYLEAGAASPADWKAKHFIDELKRNGVSVKPAGENAGTPVFASLSMPRAYSGHINLSAKNRELAEKTFGARNGMVMVSFGSPFVFGGFRGKTSAEICAFCGIEEFQRAAARALCGKGSADGKMPVRL